MNFFPWPQTPQTPQTLLIRSIRRSANATQAPGSFDRSEKGSYTVRYYDHLGKKRNRGCGKLTESDAEALQIELQYLMDLDRSKDDRVVQGVDRYAYSLFYGEEKKFSGSEFTTNLSQAEKSSKPVEGNPEMELFFLLTQIRNLTEENNELKKALDESLSYKQKYEAIRRTQEGIWAEALERCDTLQIAYDKFLKDNARLTSLMNHTGILNPFRDLHSSKNISELRARDVKEFIVSQIKPDQIYEKRYNRIRVSFSKFFNWAKAEYKIINIMDDVPLLKEKEGEGEIHWHTVEEVTSVMDKQNIYWRTITGIMAFSGLRAGEVRGLRNQDIVDSGSNFKIIVTPHSERGLKSNNSKRVVQVNKQYLHSVLTEYLSSDYPGEKYLFPCTRNTITDSELWRGSHFSLYLTNPNPAGNGSVDGCALPSGMDSRSLRRTFGSLLLRSGRSEAEVAAAMGNTVSMVRKHYAKILGCEVDIVF